MDPASLAEAIADESPPEELDAQLSLALDSHDAWLERCQLARAGTLLSGFLAHIVATVPFYRTLFAPGTPTLRLSDFPITERARVNQLGPDLLSDRFRDESAWLRLTTNRTFRNAIYVSMDRATVYDDLYGDWAVIATRFPGLREAVPPGQPGIFYISDARSHTRTTLIVPSMRATLARRLPLGHGSDTDANIVRYLRSVEVPIMTGKPSSFVRLADLDEDLGSGRIRARAILASGATLYEEDRARIESWFGCPVRDAYVTTESGLTAMDCVQRTGFHVREDRVVLEIAGDDGHIRGEGTGDLLVTNAFNWAHAFVRYRIGDRVTLARGACACGHVGATLVSPVLRDAQHFDVAGATIPCRDLVPLFADAGISQYQVVQTRDGRLVARFRARPHTDAGATAGRLAARLRDALGLEVSVTAVDALFPTGGKLRRFVIGED